MPWALIGTEGLWGGKTSLEAEEERRLRVEAMVLGFTGKLWKLLGGPGRGPVLLRLRTWV